MRPKMLAVVAIAGLMVTGCGGQSRSAAPEVESMTGVPSNAPIQPVAPSPAVAASTGASDTPQSTAVSGAVKCAGHGTCGIGDIGPGGGVVFYDAGSAQDWGRYLEVAPRKWSGSVEDPKAVWCDQPAQWAVAKAANRDGIGEGLGNTDRIFAIQPCAEGTALRMARNYRGAGLNDWYLPSKDELAALYSASDSVPDVRLGWYWSSSRSSAYNAMTANFFNGGATRSAAFPSMFQVRPIRAF